MIVYFSTTSPTPSGAKSLTAWRLVPSPDKRKMNPGDIMTAVVDGVHYQGTVQKDGSALLRPDPIPDRRKGK